MKIYFISLICLVSFSVSAEERWVCGIAFPLESQSSVDDKTISLRLGAEEVLVGRTQVDKAIVQYYLKNVSAGPLKTPTAQDECLFRALQERNDGIAFEILRYLLLSSDTDLSRFSSIVVKLDEFSRSRDLHKRLLVDIGKSIPKPKLLAPLLVSIGAADLDWLRTNANTWVYLLGSSFRRYIKQRLFTLLLGERYTESEKVLDLYQAMYGADDAELQRLKRVLSKARAISSDTDADASLFTQPVIELMKEEPDSDKALYPLLVDHVLRAGRKFVEVGKADKVFELLSDLDFERRTPELHELVKQALSNFPQEKRNKLESEKIRKLLQDYSVKDPGIRELYVKTVVSELTSLVRQGEMVRAESLFKLLIRMNPDPSEANDVARLRMARAYIRRDQDGLALQKLDNIGDDLDILQQTEVFLRKFYLRVPIRVLFWLGGLFVISLLALRWRGIPGILRGLSRKGNEEEEFDASRYVYDMEPFVKQIGGSWHPQIREYFEYLQILGLPPGAKVAQIKAAYRSKMKKLHPDMKKGESSEEFLETRHAYEKLLALEEEFQFSTYEKFLQN